MSEQRATAGVPRWDLADRMRKSLRTSGVSIEDMANYLGVSRRSVSNWTGGRIEPSTQTLRLWALRCGVPYEWLCHGDLNACLLGVPAGQGGRSNSMQSRPTLALAVAA